MTRWVAVHAHYHDDQDRLVRDGIRPAVRALRAGGRADRAFFLRYWKHGPHVRVRVRAAAGTDPAAVQEDLLTALREFTARCPSRRPVDPGPFRAAQARLAALEGEPATDHVEPDNAVLPARYEPEYGKYGGPDGVAVAEDVFDASSRAVFALLDDIGTRPGRRSLVALAMLVAGMRELALADPAGFLDRYEATWTPYALDAFRQQWPAGLARDRRAATACVASVLAGSDLAGTEPWVAALRSAHGRLRRADRDGGARLPHLLTHYAHTTSNRLGLLPADEAYLAFLARSVLPDAVRLADVAGVAS